jgi:ribulose-phosphate 3-epimerase
VIQPRLYASLTAADPATLGDTAARLVAAGVDGLHLDIADGNFVPYITFGPALVASLRRRLPAAVLDVHLMVNHPESYLDQLAAAGATRVTFHAEATAYPWRTVTVAHAAGISRVGIALNPASPLELIDSARHGVSLVNVLSTEPDCAGEALLPSTEDRLCALRRRIGADMPVLVDGGVTAEALPGLIEAGATEFVVGRAITEDSRPAAAIQMLREALRVRGAG